MTHLSFPSAFIGNPLLLIQPGMDFRLRGNNVFFKLHSSFCKRLQRYLIMENRTSGPNCGQGEDCRL